jgi:hypothetical protein
LFGGIVMAKKITFLLVLLLVLLGASVTAFAAGTESTTPAADNVEANTLAEVSISDVEAIYGDVFLDVSSKSDTKVIKVVYERVYNLENPLRYTFTGSAADKSTDMKNPIIMMMYIKVDGKYIPLCDIDTGDNITKGLIITNSKVDLKYLGVNKVNEIRIVAYRKSEAGRLQLNNNLQITDMDITVSPWKLVEKIKMTYDQLVNTVNELTKP